MSDLSGGLFGHRTKQIVDGAWDERAPGTGLRDYQIGGINEVFAALKAGKNRVVAQAPTGAGKTIIGSEIVRLGLRSGRRITFTAPMISLIDQTRERFMQWGIPGDLIGVIQADHPETNSFRPIQVASVQTLNRRSWPDSNLFIVDEAHLMHKTIKAAMDAKPDVKFIGLTATPWARGMGTWWDDLVIISTLHELIEAGHLSKYRLYAPSHPDLSGVKTVAGDYHEGQLAKVMSDAKLVGDVVLTWLEKGEGRPTLCFCVDRAHARAVEADFAKAGVPVAYVDAYTSREDRRKIGEDLAAGRIKIIVNIGTMTTGVDLDIRCIILARPTKSEMLFVQMVGRGLRTADGKDDCIVLDHTDTSLNLGLPDEIHYFALDDGKPRPKGAANPAKKPVALPRECKNCGAVIPAGTPRCEHCGHVSVFKQAPAARDGELKQIHGKQSAASGDRREWWASLLALAEEKGKSRSWALANFRQKFGDWPKGLPDRPADEPSPMVRSWVKARAIAYAKAKEKEREAGQVRLAGRAVQSDLFRRPPVGRWR